MNLVINYKDKARLSLADVSLTLSDNGSILFIVKHDNCDPETVEIKSEEIDTIEISFGVDK